MLLLAYYLVLGILALFLQSVLPYAVPFLAGWLISSLVLLVVVCASIDLADGRGLLLAAILGFWVDLNVKHPLGITVLAFGFLSLLIVAQGDSKTEVQVPRTLIFQLLATVVGTFLFLILDYLSHLLQVLWTLPWSAWFWKWPFSVWRTAALACVSNAIMTLWLFPIMRFLPQRLGLMEKGLQPPTLLEHRPYVR